MTDSSEDRYFARDDRLRGGSVLIIGVGSVGSYLAEELALLGIRLLSLVDKEELAVENVLRHVLKDPDVGKPKATTLARRIRDGFPPCTTKGLDANFLDLDEQDQLGLINQVDLVVGATDSDDCQRRINELCVAVGKPAVYPAFWSGESIIDAEAGHVLRVVPGEGGPCYACAVGWLPRGVEAGAINGNGSDIRLVSDLAAKVVIGILHPEDIYESVIEEGRTAILVHALYPPSDSIAHLFAEGNTRPVRISLSPDRCSVCGGQAPPPPDPPPPMPTPEFTIEDFLFLLVRASWLLGTIGLLLILIRIDGIVHLTATSNVLKILLFGVLNLAVVVFGLWLTFRSDEVFDPTEPVVAWGLVVASLVLLIVGGFVLAGSGSGPPPQTAAPPSAVPGSATALPATASTSFNVRPEFSTTSATVSGSSEDNAGDSFNVSLTPSLNGFMLDVGITASYNAAQYGAGTSATELTSESCMDIDVPSQNGMGGGTYYEPPLKASLTSAGGEITGNLVYAAVLPGTYSFDFSCLGVDASESPIDVGRVTTANLGVLGGTGTNQDNGLVVFSEQTSSTDTVVFYGVVGGTNDGSLTQTVPNSCIIYGNAQQGNLMARPTAQATQQRVTGDIQFFAAGSSQYFEVGSMTFDRSSSQLDLGNQADGAEFAYDCTPGESFSTVTDGSSRIGL